MSVVRARQSNLLSLVVTALMLLLGPRRAFASPVVEVSLGADCPALSATQIGALTELDLKDEERLERVLVRIDCQGRVLRVQASSQPDQSDYERTLSAALLEQAGAERTIAVTVSQMILAERFRLEAPPPPPKPAPVVAIAPRQKRKAPPARPAELGLRVQGELALLRRGGARAVLSEGVGAAVGLQVAGPFWLEAHTLYERAEFKRILGEVDASVLWLRFGPALVARSKHLELHGALLAALGQTTLAGHARAGNRDDTLNGVSAAGDACFGPTLLVGPVTLSAQAVVGYGLKTPRAYVRGESGVSMGGFYAGALLSLGFSLRR